MSSRSRLPGEIAEAGAHVRALMMRMHESRTRRLRAAGFDEATSRYLSELRTPKLM